MFFFSLLQNIDLHNVGRSIFDGEVVERSVASRDGLELAVEIEEHLAERHLAVRPLARRTGVRRPLPHHQRHPPGQRGWTADHDS